MLDNSKARPSLTAQIAESQVYRKEELPESGRAISVLCRAYRLPFVLRMLSLRKNIDIQYIALLDVTQGMHSQTSFKFGNGEKKIPTGGIGRLLAEYSHLEMYASVDDHDICQLATAGIYTYCRVPYKKSKPLHIPNYLTSFNKERWERVYSLLADDESRKILAARIKSITLGDYSYARPSAYPQYFHPHLRSLCGGHVIDAGVSASVQRTVDLINKVGPEGKVWSFEPSPESYTIAKKKLSHFHSINTLLPIGLFSHKDTIPFLLSDGGSRIIEEDKGLLPGERTCNATVQSLDEIVDMYTIPHIDFIKMDIESAELPALTGAERTLRRVRPDLAICLYHKKDKEALEIIEYIVSLDLNYQLYLGQHSVDEYYEYVLYAIA